MSFAVRSFAKKKVLSGAFQLFQRRKMAIYMQFADLPGTVTESSHRNWIEINSFTFGAGRGITSRTPGNTTNREASTVSISEISVSKEMDETSPKLFTLACIGTGKQVKIDFCRTGSAPLVYASYELSNALVSSYSVSGDGSGQNPRENLTLNFDKITFKYTPYTAAGEPGSPITSTYDLVAAKSS